MNKLRVFVLAGAGATALWMAAVATPHDEIITRPVTPRSGLRLTDFYIHDPWILAEESSQTYYLYTAAPTLQTGMNRTGTFAYKSKDLVTWEGPFVVFTCPDDSWAAPQV